MNDFISVILFSLAAYASASSIPAKVAAASGALIRGASTIIMK